MDKSADLPSADGEMTTFCSSWRAIDIQLSSKTSSRVDSMVLTAAIAPLSKPPLSGGVTTGSEVAGTACNCLCSVRRCCSNPSNMWSRAGMAACPAIRRSAIFSPMALCFVSIALISDRSRSGASVACCCPHVTAALMSRLIPFEIISYEEIVGHSRDDPFFQFETVDGFAIRADNAAEVVDRQLLLPVGTTISVPGHDRIGTEAMGAFQDAAQQVLRPVAPVKAVCGRPGKALFDLHLPLLDGGPKVVGDNSQLGLFANDPFIAVVVARDTFLRIGVLAVFAPVPDDSANIEFIVQDAAATADFRGSRCHAIWLRAAQVRRGRGCLVRQRGLSANGLWHIPRKSSG
nr:hypothetical protein [Rhizobium leguminosarum]